MNWASVLGWEFPQRGELRCSQSRTVIPPWTLLLPSLGCRPHPDVPCPQPRCDCATRWWDSSAPGALVTTLSSNRWLWHPLAETANSCSLLLMGWISKAGIQGLPRFAANLLLTAMLCRCVRNRADGQETYISGPAMLLVERGESPMKKTWFLPRRRSLVGEETVYFM